jgi:thiol-disulfide isomerase/thioredoxin
MKFTSLVLILLMSAQLLADQIPDQCQSFHVNTGTFRYWDEAKAVSDLPFTDEQGRQFKLSDFKGRPMLLHFWGTWCPPCLLEMPALSRLAQSPPLEWLLILPISRDSGGTKQVLAFYRKYGIEGLPVTADRWGKLAHALAINKVPETIYINRQGREIGRLTGMLDWDLPEVRNHLRACLGG